MSGFSDSVICPNCGEDCNRYTDYKPIDIVSLDCINCGLYTEIRVRQTDLQSLNEWREQVELKPLKKLPKFTVDEHGYKD